MRLFPYFRAAALATALFLSFAPVFAQERTDFNRKQTYDVQHYTLRTSFDHAKRTVFGETTIRLRPVIEQLRTVELDAVDLRVESAVLEPAGTQLKYTAAKGTLTVTLDKDYGPGDEVALRIKHSATPKKGVYFVDEKRDKEKTVHSAQIWTQGQPDEARHWFPNFDFPSDKATTEQFITVPAKQTVISNGVLVARRENGDGTATFHYRMDVPHSTYLISFVVGEYVKVEEEFGGVPLGYYVYPGREDLVPLAYGKTKDMMRAFEEMTGLKYPYNKYDQTMVANFKFGGMENITATTMADTEIGNARVLFFRGFVEDLVAHELAHAWFGNLVTCRNWAELWLNEGFATFMEAAVREKMYGRRDYMRKISLDAEMFITDDEVGKRKFGLFNREADRVSELFDRPAITYNKGGVVLHQLREQVGDDAFWKAIRIYLDRHKFGSVETKDLRSAMEEASGQDLEWFFDQWVYGLGYPKVDIKYSYNERRKILTLNVNQTQKPERFTPAAFRLPLEIEVKGAGKEPAVVRNITVTKRNEVIEVPVNFPPGAVTVDPAGKILLKRVKIAAAK